MTKQQLSSDLTDRLLALDTCAVSDALDSLRLPPAITGIQRLATNRRIGGRVVTVRLDAKPPVGGSLRHLCTGAIEAAQAGDIIVVEQRTGIDAAGWGGVLSTGAKLRGLAGVILDGPARDIDEAMQLDFPVFARNTTARTARGRVWEQEFNGPITVGDVTVRTGDFVLADSSAVVFIPGDRLDEVLTAAERIVRKERLMCVDLRAGNPVTAVMGTNYETMLELTNNSKSD